TIVLSYRRPDRRTALGFGALATLSLAALVLAGVPSALAQSKLEAHYTASIGGIPIGKGTWVIEIGEAQYQAAANAQVAGVLRAVTSGEGSAAVRGSVNAGHPVPSTFAVQVTADKKSDE